MNKEVTMAALRRRNVVKAVVEYAGGHDEGGVEGVTLTIKNADGSTREEPFRVQWRARSVYDPQANKYVELKPTEDEQLMDLLSEPVEEQWGGFAGEFYVSGRVVFDVEKGTIKMGEDVETPVSHPRSRSW